MRERLLGGVRDLLAGVCDGRDGFAKRVTRRERWMGDARTWGRGRRRSGVAAVARSTRSTAVGEDDRRANDRARRRGGAGLDGARPPTRMREAASPSEMPLRRAVGREAGGGEGGRGRLEKSGNSTTLAMQMWKIAERWQEEAGGEFGVRRMRARGRNRGRTDGSTIACAWWTGEKLCTLPENQPSSSTRTVVALQPGLHPCPGSAPLRASFSRECPRVRPNQAEDPCHRPIPLQ